MTFCDKPGELLDLDGIKVGQSLYELELSNPIKYTDHLGLYVDIEEKLDNKVGELANALAGTIVREGRIYIRLEKCGSSTSTTSPALIGSASRSSTAPASRPSSFPAGEYRVVAVYDKLTIYTGYVSTAYILKKGGVDWVEATNEQIAEAEKEHDRAMSFEQNYWQPRLKQVWEDNIGSLGKALTSLPPGSFEKLSLGVNSEIGLLRKKIVPGWQAVEKADADLRAQNMKNPFPLRKDWGDTMWGYVTIEYGLEKPGWATPTATSTSARSSRPSTKPAG